MIYDMMKKPQPGDFFWWENPLEKTEEDYDTHLLCGDRPVFIINATPSSFSFIPCTSQIKKYKQIHILDKFDETKRYNLKDQVLTETDDSRLGKYIGSVNDRTLQFVKAQIGANITNPFIHSTSEKTPFVKIPIGKVCAYGESLFLVTSRMGNDLMGLVPLTVSSLNEEQNLYINDKNTNVKYKVNFDKYVRINWYKVDKYKLDIVGSVSKGVLDFINWKIQESLQKKIDSLISKNSELEFLLEKKNGKFNVSKKSTPIHNSTTSTEKVKVVQDNKIVEVEKKPLTQPLIVDPSLVSLLLNKDDKIVEKVDVEEDEPTVESDDLETFNEYSFDEYFKPINDSKQLLEIHNLDELMARYYETPEDYIKRTGNTINNFRIFMDLLVSSIVWDKLPEKFFIE